MSPRLRRFDVDRMRKYRPHPDALVRKVPRGDVIADPDLLQRIGWQMAQTMGPGDGRGFDMHIDSPPGSETVTLTVTRATRPVTRNVR